MGDPEADGSGTLYTGQWCPEYACDLLRGHEGPHRTLRVPEVHWTPAGDWQEQPHPEGGEGDCWAELIEAIGPSHPLHSACVERRAVGSERYGQPLRRGDGRDHERDLREELLDAAVYAWATGREDLARGLLDEVTDEGPLSHAVELRQQIGDLEERLVSAEIDLALERTGHGEARADLSLVDRVLDGLSAPEGPRAFRLGWLAASMARRR